MGFWLFVEVWGPKRQRDLNDQRYGAASDVTLPF